MAAVKKLVNQVRHTRLASTLTFTAWLKDVS